MQIKVGVQVDFLHSQQQHLFNNSPFSLSWGTVSPLHMNHQAAAAAKSLQSWPTLYDPIDGSPPGSPSPGILQARTLGWVAISFSNAWKWKVKVKSLSRVRLLAALWTAAHQAPPSMGFSRQENWSGVPLPSLEPSSCRHPNIWACFPVSDHAGQRVCLACTVTCVHPLQVVAVLCTSLYRVQQHLHFKLRRSGSRKAAAT